MPLALKVVLFLLPPAAVVAAYIYMKAKGYDLNPPNPPAALPIDENDGEVDQDD